MRRLAASALIAVVATGCAGGERPSTRAEPSTTTAPPGEAEGIGPELAAFLQRAAAGGDAAFSAEYAVLRKLGGTESTVLVESAPPALRLTVGDLVVIDGPSPATCRLEERRCDGQVRQEQLAPLGLFTGFATSGPRQAIEGLAARVDDQPPIFSVRTVAGVELDCVSIPVQQSVTNTSCLTPDGVFGYVDNPALRFELTSYAPTAPDEPLEPPFPIT